MIGVIVHSVKRYTSQDEKRDAINLLYSNSYGGLLVSLLAGSALVFGFENVDLASRKFIWWSLFAISLGIRSVDLIYWKVKLSAREYDCKWPLRRFISGAILVAFLWGSYAIFVVDLSKIVQLICTVIVLSAMAGGSATVLAGSKVLAMSYSSILLLPTSLYYFLSGIGSHQLLGGLGLVFSFVMISSAKKASDFTKNAIYLKNHNRILVEEMKIEKREVTRINTELNVAYEEINKSNDSLELEVARRTEQIHQLSNLDPLTRLYNRNAFIHALSKLLENSKRENLPLALLFVDLDGFKQINDALGHEVGDKVLKVVTQRILKLKADGNVGRWGGDEFVLALPNCDEQGAKLHAKQVVASIASTITFGSLKLNIGASVGIALSPEHSDKEQQLIQYADIAMYQQKKSGERLPHVFSNDLLLELQEKERLREGLRDALNKDELFVVYQPIMDADGKQITSCEALLRWSFCDQVVSPAIFIEIAEQAGLIIEIGRWVLRKACQDATQWQDISHCKVSVNVSMLQLLDDTFIEYLDESLEQSGLPSHRLVLEITESTFAENQDQIKKLLDEIKLRDVGVSIDDFGTGYSSMSQLQTLPFDILKIDRSFVNNMLDKGQAIIKATLFIAQELHFKTVAEGVETEQQAVELKMLGVDYLQGFLFAKPMRLAQLLEYLKS